MIQPKTPNYLYEPQQGSPVTGQSAGFFVPAKKFSFDEAEALRDLAISEAERHRLVEDSESPTGKKAQTEYAKRQFLHEFNGISAKHDHDRKMAERFGMVDKLGRPVVPIQSVEQQIARVETPLNTPGTKTVFEKRAWSNEFRVRTETEAYHQPEVQEGERESLMLSQGGARKIADSCAYVAVERGGFTTFVTLTFNEKKRAAIFAEGDFCYVDEKPVVEPVPVQTPKRIGKKTQGDYCLLKDRPQPAPVHKPLTIQKEASRMFDGWQKVYQRGVKGKAIPGHGEGELLDYIWVVEIPENEQGDKNPHLHVLMRWAVPYELFKPWAAHLENLWGHGFAHLEKIDDPLAAGAYMAKAAGYITKASGQADQGVVRGNRYGISSEARAPGWEKLGESQLHIMGQLIADIYDHLTEYQGEDFRERKAINNAREELLEIGRKKQAERSDNRYPLSIKECREQLGEQLQAVRERIKAVPIRANKYQVVIEGELNFYRFMTWAESVDTDKELFPEWLPGKPKGANYIHGRSPDHDQKKYIDDLHKSSRVMKKHRQIRAWEKEAVTLSVSEQISHYWQQCKEWAMDLVSWNEYEAMEL